MGSSGKFERGNRSNALWGNSGKGSPRAIGTRHSVWQPRRLAVAALAASLSLVAATTAAAQTNKAAAKTSGSTYIPSSLLAAAQANPGATFHVILQGQKVTTEQLVQNVKGDLSALKADASAKFASVKGERDQARSDASKANQDASQAKGTAKAAFRAQKLALAQAKSAEAASLETSVNDSQTELAQAAAPYSFRHQFKNALVGGAVDLSGRQLVRLVASGKVAAITPDSAVKSTSYSDAEMWRQTTDVYPLWTMFDPANGIFEGLAPQAPAIAIVDSGIDTSAGDFGSRVIDRVNLSSLSTDSVLDAEGHGTMVASIAAGSGTDYPGVAQNAPLVDVRTADANGMSLTSDVIAGADWILAHAAQDNIRVANFSMAGGYASSFRFDPLDKAVENLWFHGIVVVAAAGNNGQDAAITMGAAPGNDPFIITVGATDQQSTSSPFDDTVAPWSAYGYTLDGFSKPDVVAPGRYMIAATPPAGSTIASTVPDRVVAPGYMWMSGTSFSAPIVAGAVAQMLAYHPDWTPGQVKGALMLTSNYLENSGWQATGVGEIDAASAASLDFTPPNANENLDALVTTDPTTGEMVFDQASWASAVSSDASWSSASWASASWSTASWSTASWSTASWSTASWSASVDSQMQPTTTYSEVTYGQSIWAP